MKNEYHSLMITHNRDVARSLKRRGFDIVGERFDNHSKPFEFTLWGDARKINSRERPAIEGTEFDSKIIK